MSKPGTGCCYRCPNDRDTTVLRVSSILIDYGFTLLDPASGIGVDEPAHIKVFAVGFPPFWETDFVRHISVLATGQPYFEVKIRPLNRELLVGVT